MKLLLALLVSISAFAVSGRAQTVANTSNVLHPIMKDGKRNAPSSLDRDPGLAAEYRNPGPSRAAMAPPVPLEPAKPAVIVAKVDSSLAASPISLIGTISGIKGRMTITNIGSQVVTPVATFAVCNEKGFQIGTAAKTGEALAPNEVEKIDILATNLNAVDLKLVKLIPATSK